MFGGGGAVKLGGSGWSDNPRAASGGGRARSWSSAPRWPPRSGSRGARPGGARRRRSGKRGAGDPPRDRRPSRRLPPPRRGAPVRARDRTTLGSRRRHAVDRLLFGHPEIELAALFSPEHGIRGTAPPGVRIDDTVGPGDGAPRPLPLRGDAPAHPGDARGDRGAPLRHPRHRRPLLHLHLHDGVRDGGRRGGGDPLRPSSTARTPSGASSCRATSSTPPSPPSSASSPSRCATE